MNDAPVITAEMLVEANRIAGRPPITLEEAEAILEEAVSEGFLHELGDEDGE